LYAIKTIDEVHAKGGKVGPLLHGTRGVGCLFV
jgi:hypothetical protein